MIDESAFLHPSSVVENGAVIGANCHIGPFCVVGAKVKLGRGVRLHSHVAIAGDTEIGDETQIWPHASIGHQPQDLKYNGEETKLVIGKRNMIRESTSINTGTVQGGGITQIGNDNLFMLGAHIGHDCIIGNDIVFANNAAISGHVRVDDGAIIGGQVGVIQFTRIGKGAMIGAGSMVAADVLPYGLTNTSRAELANLNLVGLKRRNVSREGIRALQSLYKNLFDGSEALRVRAQQLSDAGDVTTEMKEVIDFILEESDRSFLSPAKGG